MAKLFENNTEIKFPGVTFILGNGFDLHLGMKTSYNDMYEGYIKSPSATPVIEVFKKELSQREPYGRWADFEMGMAEYAQTLSSEDELIECLRDFKNYMVLHLNSENQRMMSLIQDDAYIVEISNELNRSFNKFHDKFVPNVRNQLERIINGGLAQYNVITFNYTTVLDAMMRVRNRHTSVTMDSPIHIHGSLGRDVVLGIDNLEQFHANEFSLSKKGQRAFVKTYFNEVFDKERVSKTQEIIRNSDVIITYGFSMGESDKTWTDLIVEWLYSDLNHHLIVFKHDKKSYGLHNFDELMDVEETKKEKLMTQLGIKDDSIFDQIHIPVGFDIFNFEFKKVVSTILPRR